MRKYAAGVDIGGSHVSSVLIDIEKNEILKDSYREQKIDNQASADEILERWAGTINSSIEVVGRDLLQGVGFAMPGPFDYSKGIALFERVKKFESLYGVNVGSALRELLHFTGEHSIRFINDASAFAIGEAWIGKARDTKKSLAITLGTGFGSAFISNGVPVLTGDTVPEFGCLWHLGYKESIADDYFSTRWFIANYDRLTGHRAAGVKEIAEKAKTDEAARELFREYGTGLGKFLAPWLQKFEPEIIVIGGNVTGAYDIFGPYLEEELLRDNASVPVELSSLKEDAAMIGSSRLIIDSYFVKVEPLLALM